MPPGITSRSPPTRGHVRDGASTGATVQNTLELTAFYQDLDWHNHPVAKTRYDDIHGVLAEVDRRCAAIGFSRPELVTSSGRGLLVAWPHKPVPAYRRDDGGTGKVVRDGAMVRWNVVQAFLRELLSDLGADAAAIPAVPFLQATRHGQSQERRHGLGHAAAGRGPARQFQQSLQDAGADDPGRSRTRGSPDGPPADVHEEVAAWRGGRSGDPPGRGSRGSLSPGVAPTGWETRHPMWQA